jgi:hypothetical protein
VVLIKFIQLFQCVLFEVIDVGDILVLDKPLVPKNHTGVVVFHVAHENDQDQDQQRKPIHSWYGAAQIFLQYSAELFPDVHNEVSVKLDRLCLLIKQTEIDLCASC